MAEKIPERSTWAVERLGLSGNEAILEIGCGRGAAVSLISPLLRKGTITAVDRSETAVRAARDRNQAHVDAGKAAFHRASIEDFECGGRRFGVIFAVNVNLFWLDADKGLDAVRRLLAKNGRLFLFYEPPSTGQRMKIARTLPEKLAADGFEVVGIEQADIGRAPLLGVTARPITT